MKRWISPAAASLAAIGLLTLPAAAFAQSPAEFYSGKTVTLTVPTGPGGGIETYARLLAKYMVKHLPGSPAMIIQHMPGGGGVVAANHLANVAPKDGSLFTIVNQGIITTQLEGKPIKFDAGKLSWLGRMSSTSQVLFVWNTAPVKTMEDVMTTEVIFGASGPGSGAHAVPIALRNLFGFKFRVVSGYKGSSDVLLAIERGEVHGRSHSWGSLKQSHSHWLADKKITIMSVAALEPLPDLPDVRPIIDFAKTDEQRDLIELLLISSELGRAFAAPPGVPADRLAALRDGFDKSMKDPELLAEATQRKIDIELMSWQRLDGLIKKAVASPPELLAKFNKALEE